MLAIVCLTSVAARADDRQLLWGDTHLHTSYSFDAFLNGNLTADPDTAYRWARGMPVIHPYTRTRIQLGRPLDFLVVSDHAEFLGALRDIYFEGIRRADAGPIDALVHWYTERTIRDAIDSGEGAELFANALPEAGDPVEAARAWTGAIKGTFDVSDDVVADTWRSVTEIAEQHYDPGRFTTFIGWEWSSNPGGANLHRVVFTDANAATAGDFLPFGSDASPFPDDLWRWLDETAAATGAQFIAIPHNSNISKGMMFGTTTLRGEPISREEAELRTRWERVAEVTQIKGDSEAHPTFAPDDPFAGFEPYPHYIQRTPGPYEPRPGDFIRTALKAGLTLESELGVNPFQFGLIGSTDAHTGISSPDETNFWGKMAVDSTPETKAGFSIAGGPSGWTMAAQGLAAVWAEENTREAIMAAFHRREVYATTGPRIRVQFFAGFTLAETPPLDRPDAIALDQPAVPMGGILEASDTDQAPQFLVIAQKDPAGAHLDRAQVVKGWRDAAGREHERVYDVAWSGDRALDAGGVLPAVGSSVDSTTGRYTNTIGAAELAVVWRDPDFDRAEPAFYYLRVLEIPTARHGLLDAIALGGTEPVEGPATIQERAYTSPIWYEP